ncbi:MAG: protein kinase [Pirellulaceae bacterium]|nr:protein kinase [Pirellulaceae bacterium]
MKKSKLLSAEQLTQAHDTVLLTSNAEEFSEILIEEGLLTEWQAQQLLAGSTRFHIGNYVLLDLLGRGGMGSVFLARHTTMNRRVALKVISRRVGRDPASLERFLTEARATASLDHPNIVRAYDVDQENDRFFIVMEYVAGHDLQALVDSEGPLEFEFLVDCIRQAAKGLSHAHQRNMVHCDIKPSNLLVNTAGVVKILDMGMARLLNESDEDSSATRDERVLGTVDYMSPEQAMGGPDFDHRADIYSLGCTMYFLLTGHPPFDEGTLAQRIVRHQTQPPPDILAEHPDVPPRLVEICLKMMAKDPAHRFQSAEEVVKALNAWHPPKQDAAAKTSESTEERKSTGVAIDEEDFKAAAPEEPAAKTFLGDDRRLIFWMATGASVLGVLLVIAAVVMMMVRDAPEEAGQATSPTRVAEATDTMKDTKPAEVTADPAPRETPPDVNQAVDPAASTASSPSTEPTSSSLDKPKDDPQRQPERPVGPAVVPSNDPVPIDPPGPTVEPVPVEPPARNELEPVAPRSRPRTRGPVKQSNPLRGLPGTVNLPPLSESGDAVVLGTTQASPRENLALALLGGDSAARGNVRLSLEARSDGPSWHVQVTEEDGGPTDVARFSYRDKQLKFAWLNGAQATPAAHLKNCILEIRAGKHVHLLRLTTPRGTPPLMFALASGSAQARLPADEPAKPEAIRLVVTAVEGLPNRAGPKKPVTIELGERRDIVLLDQNGFKLEMRVEYSQRGQATQVEATAFYQSASRDRPTRFSARQIESLHKYRVTLENRARSTGAAGGRRGLSGAEAKSLQQRLKKIEMELQGLNQFIDWYNASQGILRIQYQQQIAVDKHHLTVLDTRRFEGEETSPERAPLFTEDPGLEPAADPL